MVKIDIDKEEIKAFDIILDKAEVKPIVGFKLISIRYKIENALRKDIERAKKDANKKNR